MKTEGPIAEWLKPWLSLWLSIHLFALIVCLAANRTTSEMGRRLVRLLAPHSVVLHQDYGGVPLGMTGGDAVDCDHRIEFHLSDAEATDTGGWTGDRSTRAASLDRRWQNFEHMLAVAANEKNEEIVHLCFDYAIRQLPIERRPLVDGIRLVRIPVLSVATHASIKRGELPGSELEAITLFECKVVTLAGERIKLVPVLEKTRRSKSLLHTTLRLGVPPGTRSLGVSPGTSTRSLFISPGTRSLVIPPGTSTRSLVISPGASTRRPVISPSVQSHNLIVPPESLAITERTTDG